MKILVLIGSFFLTVSCGSGTSADAPGALLTEPERVGVSGERLLKLDLLANHYVETQKFPGIVMLVARHGQIVHLDAAGQYGVDNDKPMETDTLFRIYSMTKAVTAVAAMTLYEDGRFQMFDPVSKYLPELKGQMLLKDGELVPPASPMTMRQLFTHTAGLSYGWTLDNPVDEMYAAAQLSKAKNSEEYLAKLAELPLRFEPGTRYHYSVATDVLGIVIERISGQSLDRFFAERIFEPLGMSDTFFAVPPEKLHRLASVHVWDSENGSALVIPTEHQQDFVNVSFFSGGGGLVSTAEDYFRFAEILRNGGSSNDVRILGPKTVKFMTSDQLTPEVRAEGAGEYPSLDFFPGQSMALGFGVIINPNITPSISSRGELSWGGIAGTQYWIDPREGIVGIAMVQLMRSPWPLRFDTKVATYQALIELAEDDPASFDN